LDFLGVEKKAKGNYPQPQPLFRELPPAPPFPIEALGESLENVVRSLHRVVKAPMSLCAQSVLGCVGLAVQPYFNITIDGRKHPLALYMISVGEPGERKTGIDNIVLDVVRSFEKMIVHEFNNEQRKYKNEQDLYKLKRRKTLDKNASFEELESISPPQEPLDPVMIIPEPTFPALIVHLTKGTPSVGIFSSEGGQLFGGHAIREENIIQAATGFSLFWDKGEINRARVSDGIYNLYGKRVGLNLMIQLIIAEKFFSNEVLMGQGFLSRCLICWPSSTIGTRLYRKENLFEDPAIKEFNLKISELLDQTLPFTDQTKNELNPRNLSLEKEGYEAWVEFHDWVERRMAPKGKLHSVKAFGSKAAENALRIAGVLFGYNQHKNISSDETISIPAYLYRECNPNHEILPRRIPPHPGDITAR
jgi:hypothetical protein